MKNYVLLFFILSYFQINAQWAEYYEFEQGNPGTIHAISEHNVFVGKVFQTDLFNIKNSVATSFNFELFGFLSDIDFLNNQVGYISGGCYYVFEDCPSTTFYKTTDGGESWEQILSNLFTTGVIKSISLPSENDIFALAQYNGLIHSTNAGDSWETISLPSGFAPNIYMDAEFITPELGYIAFMNGYENLPSGSVPKNYVLKTQNGGTSWEEVFFITPESGNLLDIDFVNPSLGFILSNDNRVFKTVNGGASWETIVVGSEQERNLQFELVSPNVAYLSTHNDEEYRGTIYKTEDGGQTWSVDFTIDSMFINAMHFIDEGNGFASINNVLYQRLATNNTSEFEHPSFSISPNPSKDFITIHFEDFSNLPFQIILRNNLGQVIKEQQVFYPNTSIPIQNLSPSIYYVELWNNNNQKLGTHKFIKK